MDLKDQIFIKALPGNDKCCECEVPRPTWCSVSFGILFCLECSGKHRGLGTHVSFVRSLDMDNFTPAQIKALQVGGNAQCNQYLSGDTVKSKYDSQLATLYKELLAAKVQEQETQVKHFQTELMRYKNHDPSTTKVTPTRRIDFTNTAPPPSFLRAFICSCKFMMSLEQDRFGCGMVWGVVGLIGIAAIWSLLHKNSAIQKMLWAGTSGCVLLMLLYMTMGFRRHRAPAFKSAVNDFSDRVHSGRAKRNPMYDLFFPPGVSIGDSVDAALVFYPGVLVDFMAYSKLMGQLSDAGILVVLVNSEPSRVACSSEGFTADHAKRIFFEIQTLLGIQVKSWALGGHSLGALTAAKLANQLGPTIVQKCVLYGSGHRYFYSHIQDQTKIQVLTIDGSNDRILLSPSPGGTLEELRRASKAHPTQHILIEGGNHSGFGHYGPQIFPRKDGERVGLTLDDQHKQILTPTISFLKPTKENKQD